MPNSFDFEPRSPSNRYMFVVGVCFILVASIAAVLMVMQSKGQFKKLVRVDIELANIGDGLPENSDVKFRRVLVGTVRDVTPGERGRPHIVHVALKPEYAKDIPNTVTARVIPTNAFAVSGVQLVDNGPGTGPLRSGAVVPEDTKLPTVLFQNVLARLRETLKDLGRKADSTDVGVIATLGEATDGLGRPLTDAGRQLNDIVAQLNTVVAADDTSPTLLKELTAATEGLRDTSPDLFNALDNLIRPMRTLSEKGSQLTDFLFAAHGTVNTLGGAFDNQTDRLIQIGTELTPPLGALADHAREFHGVSTRLKTLAEKWYDEGWDPSRNQFIVKAVLGLTPTRTYVRSDCPRYGALEGPSCTTAPETPTAPDLYPALGSRGFELTPGLSENRPNLAPPRHSMPDMPQGPPLPGPAPVTPNVDYNAPPPGYYPGPAPPGLATPTGPPPEAPGPPPGPLPAEGPMSAPVHQQSAPFGGNVGPVGSSHEKDQLSLIMGRPADATTELLLGPLARGATVDITVEGAGE